MAEAPIEKTVCNLAEADGWLVRKLQWVARKGAPDRLFAKDGRVILIEFKSAAGELSELQKREINKLHKAGIEAYVVSDVFSGLRLLGVKRFK